jgi:arsenical resistance protein ArsH
VKIRNSGVNDDHESFFRAHFVWAATLESLALGMALRQRLPSSIILVVSRFLLAQSRESPIASLYLTSSAISWTLGTHVVNSFQLARIVKDRNFSSTAMKAQTDVNVWNGKDKEIFDSLDHPGYSMSSDPITHVGGWLAHRAGIEGNPDWIRDEVADMITQYDYTAMPLGRAPRILVLYGSLRETSFSRKLAYEFARLLELVKCDVRVYNPRGLPVRDPTLEDEIKVQEIRALTQWSDGHVWVSPEMHGCITGVFKNQIDWIPLNTGSVRPTQGKTCCVAQVNGGSQSFNTVNYLRILARWMRMPCCTNQSSVAKAWQEFDEAGRMKPSDMRDRVVDVAEEFAKFTAVMAPVSDELTDRYSERKETLEKGRLLTQEEKERQKTAVTAAATPATNGIV